MKNEENGLSAIKINNPTTPEQSLAKLIIETVDDAVIRVGASANCYDVPADADSGAEYVAARVRSVIVGACTRRAQQSAPSPSVREAAEEIVKQFDLEKPGWVTLGRITIDRETETEKFERTSETATDRIAAIITRFCSPVSAAGGDEVPEWSQEHRDHPLDGPD